MSGYLIAIISIIWFLYGPQVVHYIPRCLAGCILLHTGLGLLHDALVESWSTLDVYEYSSVLILTVVMTR